MSRPPKKANQKKAHVISTRLSGAEYKIFINKLARARMDASEFLRDVLSECEISIAKRVQLTGVLDDLPISAIVRLLLLQSSVHAKYSKDEFDVVRQLTQELQRINDNYAEMRYYLQDNDVRLYHSYLKEINEKISKILKKY